MENPFTPNFGQVPLVMAGRDEQVAEILYALNNAPGDPALTTAFVGARGTGKTVMLTYLASLAAQNGWISVNVSCEQGMLDEIVQQTVRSASSLIDAGQTSRKIKGFNIGQVFGVEWENDTGDTPTWRMRMSLLLDQLAQISTGLVLTIDEVDPSVSEMQHLASAYQHFIREERKIALFMAGLPSKVSSLLSGDTVSFLRRANQVELGSVADYEIRNAFAKTVELGGKTIDKASLDTAVAACDGFPYMMQLVGYRSWKAAGNSFSIGAAHVEDGVRMAQADLRHRVLKATLDELPPSCLAFLEAMLVDEKPSVVANIEQRLGKTSGATAQLRRILVQQGVVEPCGRGKLAFAIPQLREFLPEYLANM